MGNKLAIFLPGKQINRKMAKLMIHSDGKQTTYIYRRRQFYILGEIGFFRGFILKETLTQHKHAFVWP